MLWSDTDKTLCSCKLWERVSRSDILLLMIHASYLNVAVAYVKRRVVKRYHMLVIIGASRQRVDRSQCHTVPCATESLC